MLAQEGEDLYGRPAAQEVGLEVAAMAAGHREESVHNNLRSLAGVLLNLLAATMKERDAALARLHQTEGK